MTKVLVIDDQPVNLSLIRSILKDEYDLLFSSQGSDTLSLAKRWLPDIILLDIIMPDSNGFDICKALKIDPTTRSIPVILVTSLSDNFNEEYGFDCGAADYISKPINKNTLLARLRAHLAFHQKQKSLEDAVARRTEQLEAIQYIAIKMLGRAAEYKDNETGLHVIRMSHYAYTLTKALGWSDHMSNLILKASPMHDVGKIGIPDSILQKPSKLNDSEWEIMRKHPEFGAEIISSHNDNSISDILTMASNIALSHHEKWDGSGYPNGLSGENIPIEGRIVAIADVFDALTSQRPYKAPWSIEKTTEYITSQASKHFDPALVQLFLNNIDQFLDIMEKWSDSNESLSPT